MRCVLLKCGCVACAINGDGKPCCIEHNCVEIDNNMPDLNGRKAKCVYGNKVVDSKYTLAFFKLRLDKEFDSFYCGCYGWN